MLIKIMYSDKERKSYSQVAKMTELELAKIEVDELHPLYKFATEEIDARANNRHMIDDINAGEDAEANDIIDIGMCGDLIRSDEALEQERRAYEAALVESWYARDLMDDSSGYYDLSRVPFFF